MLSIPLTRITFATSFFLAGVACKDKAAQPPAAAEKPTADPAPTAPAPTAPATPEAGSAVKEPASATAGSAAKEAAAEEVASPPPKECWGTYELEKSPGEGRRTLTFSGQQKPEPEAWDDEGADSLVSEEFKVTADGGCEIVVIYDVSGGHSADPITERYNLTVAADGKFTGTLTVQGDLDPATKDKPKLTKLSGVRKSASK